MAEGRWHCRDSAFSFSAARLTKIRESPGRMKRRNAWQKELLVAFPRGCGDHHFLFLKKLHRGEPVQTLFREDELALIRAGWLQRDEEGRLAVTKEVAEYFAAARRPPDELGRRHAIDDGLRSARLVTLRRARTYAAA